MLDANHASILANKDQLITKWITVAPADQKLRRKLARTAISLVMPAFFITGLAACNEDNNGINGMGGGIGTGDVSVGSVYSKVNFVPAGSYVHGGFDESAAEIIAFHPASRRSFVVNAQNKKVDVIDLTDINSPTFISSLDVADIGSTVNSVAICYEVRQE